MGVQSDYDFKVPYSPLPGTLLRAKNLISRKYESAPNAKTSSVVTRGKANDTCQYCGDNPTEPIGLIVLDTPHGNGHIGETSLGWPIWPDINLGDSINVLVDGYMYAYVSGIKAPIGYQLYYNNLSGQLSTISGLGYTPINAWLAEDYPGIGQQVQATLIRIRL